MKSSRLILAAGIFFSLIGISGFAQQPPPNIVPIPQQYEWHNSTTTIANLESIQLQPEATTADSFTAGLLQQVLQDYHDVTVEIQYSTESPEHAILVQSGRVDETPEDLPEFSRSASYSLTISDGNIAIKAPTATGRFYGAMSLKQLLIAADENLANLSVVDYPLLRFRGVSDDFSRGQVSTLENFTRIIRFLAEHKMNTYMPYMEDLIRLDNYPAIGENRGALSKEELRELQAYAKQYHVEIIPIFQTLGHYENILNMEQYVKYAEYPGAASLNPQSEDSFEFLSNLLEEVVPLFESVYFHIGADESWDIGKGASGKYVDRYDMATVHASHYKRVYDLVHGKYNKKLFMYGDIILQNPTILNQIPDDIIMMDWHYWATDNYPSTEVFARANQPFIVSAGIQNWRSAYPDQTAAWLNIYNLTLEGHRDGALGSVTSNWGDYGAFNFREINYRGYAYAAECAWNIKGAEQATIDDRFNRTFYGSNDVTLHSIENLLTHITRDAGIKQVWQNPFGAPESNGHNILMGSLDMRKNATTIIGQVEKTKPDLIRNQEHLDYHRYAARFMHWYAEAHEFAQWIRNISREYIEASDRKTFATHGVEWGRKLSTEIQELNNQHRELWLRTNREANLDRLMTLFEYQEAYLQEMVQALGENRWAIPTTVPSQFIAAHGASKEQVIPTAYLRKSFTLPGKRVDQAYLQLIGDSDATVWLNNEEIGRVIATKSLSLWVELQRVKYWDVTDQLRRGNSNVIAARTTSYRNDRPGSANIYLEIHYSDGSTERITSDQYWKSNTLPDENWQAIDFNDRYWLPVSVVSYPWTVNAPMFDRSMPSFIDF